MDQVINAISTIGFPIVICLLMGWFIYEIYKKSTEQNMKNLEKIQQDCKEREEKLYNELVENRKINGQFAEIISKYDMRLENIQRDISEIKGKLD